MTRPQISWFLHDVEMWLLVISIFVGGIVLLPVWLVYGGIWLLWQKFDAKIEKIQTR